jgi:ubiquinone/menaquinone biosynthesis C-methylase UbiE
MQTNGLIGFWGRRVMPLVYDPFVWLGERAGMSALRERQLAAAAGSVLELGAGTGLNVPHYPRTVQRLVLSEPESGMAARLRRRSPGDGIPAEVVQAGAEDLPFEDGSFDTVVCTLVLCTVPDPVRTLTEARRVLKDGGRLLFLEHVRAEGTPSLARWQNRLEPAWRAFAYGCRCNQDTMAIIGRLRFRVTKAEQARWRAMPPIVRPLVLGEAVAA